ncbi:MAG: hypothetical protein QXI12_04395 [Candidatus Methanomethyliaceae archaeon]
MLGGYGKPMVFLMGVTVVPIYGGLILALMYPQYFFTYLSVGIICMVLGIFLYFTWSQVRYRRYQCIGLTLQYADGSDDYFNVIYRDMPVDLGKSQDGKFQYSIKDIEGNAWLLMLDHPLEEVIPRFEEMPIGATISPILTRFVTGVMLNEAELYQGQKISLLDRIMRRKPEDLKVSVRTVYCYGTPVKVKQTKTPEMAMPTKSAAKALYEKWFDYTFIDLKTELEQCRSDRENLIKIAQDESAIKLKIGHIQIEEEGYRFPWKLVLAISGVAIAVYLLLWFLKVIR